MAADAKARAVLTCTGSLHDGPGLCVRPRPDRPLLEVVDAQTSVQGLHRRIHRARTDADASDRFVLPNQIEPDFDA